MKQSSEHFALRPDCAVFVSVNSVFLLLSFLGWHWFLSLLDLHARLVPIRQHRKRVGWSQEKLAEKSDLHPVYFGQVERGEQVISVQASVRVAKALKVKLADLVVGI